MMGWMNHVSIRWKLVFATVLTSALALLFSGAIMAWYDSQVFRTQKSLDVTVEAASLSEHRDRTSKGWERWPECGSTTWSCRSPGGR